ncbi:MAG: hypothetical protein FWG99_02275 [Treponema sp.]|nr:hypothetical protein [Treponema sp.]
MKKLLVLTGFFIFLTLGAWGQTNYTWVGSGGDNLWSNISNWAVGGSAATSAPGPGASVTITNAAGVIMDMAPNPSTHSIANLTINNTSFALNQPLEITGNITLGNGSNFNGGGGSLTVRGNWSTIGTGAFNHGGGTVIFDIDAAQTRNLNHANSTFNNLIKTGAGTLSVSTVGDLTVNGNFEINAGAMVAPGWSLLLTGNNSQNINANGATVGSLTVDKSGGTAILNQDLTVNGDVTLTNGNLDLGNAILTVHGSWNRTGGTFNNNGIPTPPTAGTVIFDIASGSTTLNHTGSAFYNLTKTGAGTLSGSVAPGTALRVWGNLEILDGVLDLFNSGSQITLNVSGNLNNTVGPFGLTGINYLVLSGNTQAINANGAAVVAVNVSAAGTKTLTGNLTVTGDVNFYLGALNGGSATLTVGGNWLRTSLSGTGTFVGNGGTVVFTGTGAQSLDPTTSSSLSPFNNITKNGGGTLTVNGNLNVNGTFTCSGTVEFPGSNSNQSITNLTLNSGATLRRIVSDSGQWDLATLTLENFSSSTSPTLPSISDCNYVAPGILGLEAGYDASDGGNNNDVFAPLGTTHVWLGNSTGWAVATNWSTNTVPNTMSSVYIPVTANNPVLSAAASCGTLRIGEGAELQLGSNNLIVTGIIINNGTMFLTGISPQTVSPSTINGTGVVNFNDIDTDTLAGITNFTNLTVSAGAPTVLFTAISVSGNLLISGGALFINDNLILGGDLDNNMGTGGLVWVDELLLTGGSVQSINAGGATVQTLTVNKSGGTATIGGTLNVDTNVNLTAGTLTLASAGSPTLNVGGNWTNSGGFFDGGTGIVEFNISPGTRTLDPARSTFYMLRKVGAGTLEVHNHLNVELAVFAAAGTLLLTNSGGDFDLSTGNLTIGGNLTAGSGTITVSSGVWNRTGTFIPGTSTVVFNTAIVYGINVFYNVICTGTVEFQANQTQHITNLDARGATLTSLTPGTHWRIDTLTAAGFTTNISTNISWLNSLVNDLGRTGALGSYPATDDGNNINVFASSGTNNYIWIGAHASSADWSEAANWDSGNIPPDPLNDPTATLEIDRTGSWDLAANDAITVDTVTVTTGTLTLGDTLTCDTVSIAAGETLDAGAYTINATTISNSGTLILQGVSATQIGSHATMGGTVDFTGSGTTLAGITTFNNLKISGGNRSVAGGITVNGDLEIGVGASLAIPGGLLRLHGDLDNYAGPGGFSATSTLMLEGGSTQSINANGATVGLLNVVKDASTEAILDSDLVAGSVSLSAGSLDGGFATLTVTGDWTGNPSTPFSGNGGTVVFDISSPQDLNNINSTFNNLIKTGTGTLRVSNSLTVNGDLEINTGAVNMTGAATTVRNITLYGDLTNTVGPTGLTNVNFLYLDGGNPQNINANNAVVSQFNVIKDNGTIATLTGDITASTVVYINGGTLNGGSATLSVGSNWVNGGGTFDGGSGTVSFNNTGVTIQAFNPANSTFHNITKTVGSGALNLSTSFNLTMTGNLTISTSITNAANLTLQGGNLQSIDASGSNVTNLIVNKDPGTEATLTGNLRVTGNVTLTSGILNGGSSSVTLTVGSGWNIPTGGTGNFDGQAGTVEFNGTMAVLPLNTAGSSFSNITMNNTSPLSPNGNLNASGIVTVNTGAALVMNSGGDHNLTANSLIIAGGTLTAGVSSTITINGGTWTKTTTGTFIHNNSTVVFNNNSTVNSDTTFHNVVCNDTVTFNGSNTFNDLTCNSGSIIEFAIGSTQNITTLTFPAGAAAATLRAAGTGQWQLDTLDYTGFTSSPGNIPEISDCDYIFGSSNLGLVRGTNAVDSGNNTEVFLGNIYRWIGTSGTDNSWLTAGNWDTSGIYTQYMPATIQSGNDTLIIATQSGGSDPGAAGYPGPINVASLTIESGTLLLRNTLTADSVTTAAGQTLDMANHDLTVGTTLINAGTIRLHGLTNQVTSPSAVPGGTINYYNNSPSPPHSADWAFGNNYTNLIVENTVAMSSTGYIYVTGTSSIGSDITATSGTQIYYGSVTLTGNIAFSTPPGQETVFHDTIDNDSAITAQPLTIIGRADFRGIVGGTAKLSTINVTLSSTIRANINTTGNQTYTGNVILENDINITAASGSLVSFGGTVTGASSEHSLTITDADVRFNGNVGDGPTGYISAVTVTAGTAYINGSITSSGDQIYAAVNLGAATRTLTSNGGSIEATGIVSGTAGVNINASQGITMDDPANNLGGTVSLFNTNGLSPANAVSFQTTAPITIIGENSAAGASPNGDFSITAGGVMTIDYIGDSNTVNLNSGSSMDQTPSGSITAETLNVEAVGDINLNIGGTVTTVNLTKTSAVGNIKYVNSLVAASETLTVTANAAAGGNISITEVTGNLAIGAGGINAADMVTLISQNAVSQNTAINTTHTISGSILSVTAEVNINLGNDGNNAGIVLLTQNTPGGNITYSNDLGSDTNTLDITVSNAPGSGTVIITENSGSITGDITASGSDLTVTTVNTAGTINGNNITLSLVEARNVELYAGTPDHTDFGTPGTVTIRDYDISGNLTIYGEYVNHIMVGATNTLAGNLHVWSDDETTARTFFTDLGITWAPGASAPTPPNTWTRRAVVIVPLTYRWIGTSGTDNAWLTAGNWDSSGSYTPYTAGSLTSSDTLIIDTQFGSGGVDPAPTPGAINIDTLTISTGTLTLGGVLTADSVTTAAGQTLDMAGYNLAVGTTLTNAGTIRLHGVSSGQVLIGGSPPSTMTGGTISYYSNLGPGVNNQWVFGDTYDNLVVENTAQMDNAGALNVSGTAEIRSDISAISISVIMNSVIDADITSSGDQSYAAVDLGATTRTLTSNSGSIEATGIVSGMAGVNVYASMGIDMADPANTLGGTINLYNNLGTTPENAVNFLTTATSNITIAGENSATTGTDAGDFNINTAGNLGIGPGAGSPQPPGISAAGAISLTSTTGTVTQVVGGPVTGGTLNVTADDAINLNDTNNNVGTANFIKTSGAGNIAYQNTLSAASATLTVSASAAGGNVSITERAGNMAIGAAGINAANNISLISNSGYVSQYTTTVTTHTISGTALSVLAWGNINLGNDGNNAGTVLLTQNTPSGNITYSNDLGSDTNTLDITVTNAPGSGTVIITENSGSITGVIAASGSDLTVTTVNTAGTINGNNITLSLVEAGDVELYAGSPDHTDFGTPGTVTIGDYDISGNLTIYGEDVGYSGTLFTNTLGGNLNIWSDDETTARTFFTALVIAWPADPMPTDSWYLRSAVIIPSLTYRWVGTSGIDDDWHRAANWDTSGTYTAYSGTPALTSDDTLIIATQSGGFDPGAANYPSGTMNIATLTMQSGTLTLRNTVNAGTVIIQTNGTLALNGNDITPAAGSFTNNGTLISDGGEIIGGITSIGGTVVLNGAASPVPAHGNFPQSAPGAIIGNYANVIIKQNGIVEVPLGRIIQQSDGSTLELEAAAELNAREGSWYMGTGTAPGSFAGYHGTLKLGGGSNLIVNHLNLAGTSAAAKIEIENTGTAAIRAGGDVFIHGNMSGSSDYDIDAGNTWAEFTGDLPQLVLEMEGTAQTLEAGQPLGSLVVRSGITTLTSSPAKTFSFRGSVTINSPGALDAGQHNIAMYAGLAGPGKKYTRWENAGASVPPPPLTSPPSMAGFAFRQDSGGKVSFRKEPGDTSSVFFEIAGNTIWQEFECTEGGAVIQFSRHPDQHYFNGKFSIRGAAGNYITVTRLTDDNGWPYIYDSSSAPPPALPGSHLDGIPSYPAPADLKTESAAEQEKYWNINVFSGTYPLENLGYAKIFFSHARNQRIQINVSAMSLEAFPYYDQDTTTGYFNYDWFEAVIAEVKRILYSFLENRSGDGRLDRIRVQSSVFLNGDFSGFRARVEGYEIEGYALVSTETFEPDDDDSFYIYLVPKEELHNGDTPSWSIISNSSLMERVTGQPLAGGPETDSPMTPFDTIPARIAFALTLPGHPQTYVRMSKPVVSLTGESPVESFNGAPSYITNARLLEGSPAGGLAYLLDLVSSHNTETLAALNPVYNDTTAVFNPANGYFVLDNMAYQAQRAMEWTDPLETSGYVYRPKYPLNWGYTEYARVHDDNTAVHANGAPVLLTDVFTPPFRLLTVKMMSDLASGAGASVIPGNFVASSAVIRRSTDILVSIAPDTVNSDRYFAWPVWARNSAGSGNRAPAGTFWGQSGADAGVIWQFDGTGNLQARDIELQVRLGSALAGRGVDLVYAADVPEHLRDPREKGTRGRNSGGLWLPPMPWLPTASEYPALFFRLPGNTRTAFINAQPANPPLFNFTLSRNIPGFSSGSKLDFLLRLSGAPGDQNLYIARLDIPRAGAVPSNWYQLVRPFSFDIQDTTQQRGGVTVLNNVINPDNNESTFIRYNMVRPGRVTVQIYTLEGTLVRSVRRNDQRDAGEWTDSWNGRNNAGRAVARGMYFVRVVGPDIDEIRKIMVIR